MNKIFVFYIVFFSLSFVVQSQSYKVIYSVKFSPNIYDLTQTQQENTILLTNGNQSIFASENFLKMDSIFNLVDKNIINPYEVMGNPKQKMFKTKFDFFIIKDYNERTNVVYNKVGLDYYKYSQKNNIAWKLLSDTLQIGNYLCYKATTTFGGREYIAWFTKEIPISDGPYKFWGLPGLIIKISDMEKQYSFTLQSFEKHLEKFINLPSFASKSLKIDYEKFKIINKEYIKNPFKQLTDRGAEFVNAEDMVIPKEKLFTNQIER